MNGRDALKSFYFIPDSLLELIRNTAISFVLLIAIGYALGFMRPGSLDALMTTFTGAAAEIGLYQVSDWQLMLTILSNNLFALLFTIAIGLIPFLHLSALVLGLNALMIGALGVYYVQKGFGIVAYLAGTLPHGIVESIALVMSCAAGLYSCRASTWGILGRIEGKTVAKALGSSLRVFTRWVVPLTVISAALEAYVTPLFLSRFM
ncbi:MAG: stage II sporulation protein M [Oscillospiraceae bacterium]|nr:stage II sporulation protein M [Oscillospiraceae bacterium]